jgi:hypothetical protein
MSLTQKIHVTDIGTVFQVTIYDGATLVDLSSTTNIDFIFRKPDKSIVTRTASLYTDGVDGIVQYVMQEGDLDLKGSWKMQAELTFPEGQWWSDIIQFKVYPNLV